VQEGFRQACCGVAAKPRLAHASNVGSQLLSGLPDRPGLDAQPFIAVHGVCMSLENLAILKTLAIRPSASMSTRSMHGRGAGTGRLCRRWP